MNKIQEFDPKRCIKEGACATFNFNYSEQIFRQLAGIAEFNMKANQQQIAEFIKKEFYPEEEAEEQMIQQLEFEEGAGWEFE